MLKHVTPEKVVNIVRLSVAMTFCWPLPVNSSKIKVIGYKITQICATISITLLFLPLLYSIYLRPDDIEIVSTAVGQSICMVQSIIQTVICFSKHDTLQRVIEELRTSIREAKLHEREIFYTYLARCNVFYGSYIAEYPFDVNRTLVSVIVRAHQSIACCQCCAHVCLSVFGALLIWFTAARFECLAVEMQRSTDIVTMSICIGKQLRLKRYAEEVVSCFRLMVLFVITACMFVMTLAATAIAMNTPLIVKVAFTGLSAALLMYVYMYAWPADYMKEKSLNVSRSVYDITWYEETVGMQKDLLNILVYQKPVTLSITCLVPELSLGYFCTYVSNALSMCTALRAILDKTVA
ncbi:hypothetical protein QLX08_004134 [Tetragonisca angustula]|uniref:Odorant receptor n=1 Tax=Tetragonisca angustula TaxID=166442 RepID=A0AAW1A3P5_9HYME